METVGQEIVKIETRLRQLGTKLDRLVAKADAAGQDVNPEYRKRIDDVKGKHDVVHGKLKAYRFANGEKWDNFRNGIVAAWHELTAAFKALEP
jgi:hypothetical protein